MRLRRLHRMSAVFLGLFVAVHLGNHLTSLLGVDAHLAVMTALRTVYRRPFIEGLLLLSVGFQVLSGLRLALRAREGRSGRVERLQAVSGLYLAVFLLVHVGAVLGGRAVLSLDTNFYFAAAGFHVRPFELFFAPYYWLAVLSFFAHLGSAGYFRLFEAHPARAKALLFGALSGGALVATLLVLSLAGAFATVTVPAVYLETFHAR